MRDWDARRKGCSERMRKTETDGRDRDRQGQRDRDGERHRESEKETDRHRQRERKPVNYFLMFLRENAPVVQMCNTTTTALARHRLDISLQYAF